MLKRSTTDALDWNFENSSADDIDGIHPYPAKFISEIPATILDNFSRPSGFVADLFCGSGTTLVQCQKRGIKSLGVDLNPIACLISRVKTTPLPRDTERTLASVIGHARALRENPPKIPRLDHWFQKEIQVELASLFSSINTHGKDAKEVLLLAFSSIIVRVSNQESDTRYAAIAKHRRNGTALEEFESAALRIINALHRRSYALIQSRVYNADTLNFDFAKIEGTLAAVITSPPYPNAYEYWLYHKYRMYWLGYDPIEVKEKEIGARAHFFKSRPHTADDFVVQMTKTLSAISRVLHPRGFAAFVIGRSRIHGRIVDNAQILEDVARTNGFRTEYRSERTMAASRKSFNLAHANIKTESILVFTK